MIKVKNNIVEDFYIDPNLKTIGVQMSGGADSTLVAYLTSKAIIENNLKTKLCRITFGFGNKPDYFEKTRLIQEKITEILGKNVWTTAYTKFYPHKSMHSTLEQLKFLFENEIIDHTINGRTKNPPIDQVPDPFGTRIIERDFPERTYDKDISEPFYNTYKDKILQEYFEEGIEDLLFLTASCDVSLGNSTVFPCNKCWWCRERAWAFNKIGKTDVAAS